jgi:hypothetical protein
VRKLEEEALAALRDELEEPGALARAQNADELATSA